MDSPASSTTAPTVDLLPELRLRILDLLPPNDLTLAGRLAFKDAAQHFSQPPHRTAHLASLPLPGQVLESTWCVEGAQAALKQLTLQQRVVYLMLSPRSGCEANVELAWRLVQPGLFPEQLRVNRYLDRLEWSLRKPEAPKMGSTAIASGLARLLPSLGQRCPGLLDPARTLEAAALHCDLAGLQAVWGLVGQWVHIEDVRAYQRGVQPHEEWEEDAWRRLAASAARSTTHDATAKVAWVLETCRSLGRAERPMRHAHVCAAAAASGDLGRLRWMRDQGFPWGTAKVLQGVMQQAEFGFILQMEREGGYLPPSDHQSWTSRAVVRAAVISPKDVLAKVSCLASRGVSLEELNDAGTPTVSQAKEKAALWLEQADASVVSAFVHGLDPPGRLLILDCAINRGSLPMLRRLVEAEFSPASPVTRELLTSWPATTPEDSGRLAEAVQLMASAGWPLLEQGGPFSLREGTLALCMETDCRRHPWTVWRALVDAVPATARDLMRRAAAVNAADTGCEATLEALAELPAWEEYAGDLADEWYGDAAANGDLGTLACLRRLGVPLEGGALVTAVWCGSPLVALQWLVAQGVPVDRERLQEEVAGSMYAYLFRGIRGEEQAVREWLRGLLGEEEAAAGDAAGVGAKDKTVADGPIQTAGPAEGKEAEQEAAVGGEGQTVGAGGKEDGGCDGGSGSGQQCGKA